MEKSVEIILFNYLKRCVCFMIVCMWLCVWVYECKYACLHRSEVSDVPWNWSYRQPTWMLRTAISLQSLKSFYIGIQISNKMPRLGRRFVQQNTNHVSMRTWILFPSFYKPVTLALVNRGQLVDHSVNFRFMEKSCLKNSGRVWLRM